MTICNEMLWVSLIVNRYHKYVALNEARVHRSHLMQLGISIFLNILLFKCVLWYAFLKKHILSEYKSARFVDSLMYPRKLWKCCVTCLIPLSVSLQTGEASDNYNFTLTWKPSLVIYCEEVFLVNVHSPQSHL